MKINKYHKYFINSFSSENIIGLFSRYNNAYKEITESFAMLAAAKSLNIPLIDCYVVVVGDGASPRTGSVFAYYSQSEVLSIDPNLNIDNWIDHQTKQSQMGFKVQRLTAIRNGVEEVFVDAKNKILIVVWPHSHANMNTGNFENYSKRYDIAMPCCVPIPNNWMSIPHVFYKDMSVLSPKNEIHIWDKQPKL